MAIKPLFDAELADQIVDADLDRLFHHAVDLDGPRPDLQRLRLLGDVLARIELVEIVVVAIDLLVGDRAVEGERRVSLAGIKIDGRIGLVGDALRQRDAGSEARRSNARGRTEKRTAVEEQMLRRGAAFWHLPAAAANDVHGPYPSEWLRKEYGPDGSQASHGCGSFARAGEN